jgi:hypothetical protein
MCLPLWGLYVTQTKITKNKHDRTEFQNKNTLFLQSCLNFIAFLGCPHRRNTRVNQVTIFVGFDLVIN